MSTATRRLVEFENAEARPTPLLLLAELREIDPTVELVYFGEGSWRLGCVRANEHRAEAGRRILAFEERRSPGARNMRNIMLARLLMQGFAQVEEYVGPDPSGVVRVAAGTPNEYLTTIVEDFRYRDFMYRKDQGAEVVHNRTVALDEAARRASEARQAHYMATEGRDKYRRVVRDHKTFGPGGETGGRERTSVEYLLAEARRAGQTPGGLVLPPSLTS